MNAKSLVGSMPVIGPLIRSIVRPFSQYGAVGYPIATLWRFRGVHRRTCAVCGHEGLFRAFGDPPRWDSRCPSCDSLERHRLLALLLQLRTELIGGRVIHFAPEPSVAGLIRPMARQYQSADFLRSDCDLRLNLEQLDLADGSVDVFVASHLLEHVDDRKALSELYRCLRPGGTAIIMVPIVEAWRASYENDAIVSEDERDLHFGQFDHLRYYGADLRDRIRSAGFHLEEFAARPEDCVKYGLIRGETVFVAKRAN